MTTAKSKTKQHNDPLVEFLRSLPETGPAGFEGLVRNLLEQWTGLTFRIARTGSQCGKDGLSESQSQFYIAFEAKRYEETTGLSARSLSGELFQVKQSAPNLDLWVLAATKEVGDLAEDLRRGAEELGFDILVLDVRNDGLGPLQVLCAEYPHMLAGFCQSAVTKKITDHIDTLKQFPLYKLAVERLHRTLSDTLFGAASARIHSYSWLKNQVKNKTESYAAFSQDIGLLDMGDRLVPRGSINQHFDTWWASNKIDASICALLGEEGTGKTWALFSWLIQRFDESNGPIILPVTSSQLPPHGGDLSEILVSALKKRCGRSVEYWIKKVAAWQDRPKSEEPLLLLCFDGLNERPDFPWRQILAQAANENYSGRAAVIVTTWPKLWRSKISSGIKETVFTTEGYDDAELKLALEASGIKQSEIPDSLKPLIRKPRYCDLVVRHFPTIVKSGDMTVERLLYEDCKDKERRKLKYPVSDEDFRSILCNLARQFHSGLTTFSKTALKQFLPEVDATGAILQEITDGGLLIPAGSIEPAYMVEPRRLVHGLGMLLADHVQNATENSMHELADLIRVWLEPQPDMEKKTAIVGAAVFFSIVLPSYRQVSRRALLYSWVNIRNMTDAQDEDISAYLPGCVDDMLTVADECWRSTFDNGMAHTRLARAFVLRRDDERVKPALTKAVNRWMSYVNVKGQRFERGHDNEHLAEILSAITEKFGCKLTPGCEATFHEWSFPITDDDGLLRLARFALLIISGGDRLSFVEAFVRWAVSRRLMGRDSEFDEAAWTLRLSEEDLWPHFEPILTRMSASVDETLRKAAHLLASCLGSKEAYTLRSSKLSGLYPPNELQLDYEKDPFASITGKMSRMQCIPCMQRDDLTLHQIERKIEEHIFDPTIIAPQSFVERLSQAATNLPVEGYNAHFSSTIEDHNIKQIEPFLARFTPHDYCNMLRRAICTLPSRNDEGKRQLLIHLPGIALVIRDAEKEILAATLKEFWGKSNAWATPEAGGLPEREMFAESLGFLALSPILPVMELAKTLLLRPKHAHDLYRLQHWFDPLPTEGVSFFIDQIQTEPDQNNIIRLLWILASSKLQLKQCHREVLKAFLESANDKLRGITYRFIWATQDAALINYVDNQKSHQLTPENNWADAWRFEIIASVSKNKQIEELFTVLHLPELARIIDFRGCIQEEVDEFVILLNEIWQRIAEQNGIETAGFPSIRIELFSDCGVQFSQKSLSTNNQTRVFRSADASWGSGSLATVNDFENSLSGESEKQFAERQQAANNKLKELAANEVTSWWSLQLPIGLLQSICTKHPDLIERWVGAALQSKGMIVSCEGFYQFLCAALVGSNPMLGFALWERLKTNSSNINFNDEYGCDLMSRIPFLTDSDRANEVRSSMLKACTSDADLIKIATVAVACNCNDWLKKQIESLICASMLWQKSMGLNLASLSDLELDIERVIKEADVTSTWVEPTLDRIRGEHAKNRWARHWYKQFLTVDDEDEAYSAYVLFLKCADRRCRLWMHLLEESPGVIVKRLKFRMTNGQQIEDAINNNEKIHENHYLTIKFQKGQLFPFVDA